MLQIRPAVVFWNFSVETVFDDIVLKNRVRQQNRSLFCCLSFDNGSGYMSIQNLQSRLLALSRQRSKGKAYM